LDLGRRGAIAKRRRESGKGRCRFARGCSESREIWRELDPMQNGGEEEELCCGVVPQKDVVKASLYGRRSEPWRGVLSECVSAF
jgi:hypothetical protein